MTTLVKWPGGKGRELAHLRPLLEDRGGRFVDPFVGGGAALFAAPHRSAAANDASADLMGLYAAVAEGDPALFERLDAFAALWSAIGAAFDDAPDRVDAAVGRAAAGDDGPLLALATDCIALTPPALADLLEGWAHHAASGVPAKVARMRATEARRGVRYPAVDARATVEAAVRAGLYTSVRDRYNARRAEDPAPDSDAGRRSAPTQPTGGSGARAADFLVLREASYAAMFRFNAAGGFNVPYGGISYNRRDWAAKVAGLRAGPVRERLAATTLSCGDFGPFLDGLDLDPSDLVFVDPPYDSAFRAYDGRAFGEEDHRRLAARLAELPCPFVVVIKATPFVEATYAHPDWERTAVDQRYRWTIKGRNDPRATHLVITG